MGTFRLCLPVIRIEQHDPDNQWRGSRSDAVVRVEVEAPTARDAVERFGDVLDNLMEQAWSRPKLPR